MSRLKIKSAIDSVLESEIETNILFNIAPAIVEEYKDLNEKCDVVIEKIKKRKDKRQNKQIDSKNPLNNNLK
jgi:hypothetical protein